MFISYKKEEIKIKLSKADWNKINSLLIKYDSYKKKFNDIMKEEKNNLYRFQCYREKEIISKHNFLVKEFLKELANEFKVFKFFSVTIFITGSFARFSNKTNSDVDIHFIYSNIFKKFIYKYEEMYFYIVSIILGIERNNIHSVITTKLNNDKIEKINNDKYLSVKLYYNRNNYFSYLFYPVTKKRFFLQYNNNKSFKAFNEYIEKEILNCNREWSHNFYPITNINKFYKNYDKLCKLEKNQKISKLIKELEEQILKCNSPNSDISNIKRVYQQEMFANIFNTLNIIRMYINLFEKKMNLYDLNSIFDYYIFENCDKVVEDIYKYLWLVKKISIYCKENNIIYSIHISDEIHIEWLGKVEKQRIIVQRHLLYVLDIIKELIK